MTSADFLRTMHALGVRYLTPTHNDNVPWATRPPTYPRSPRNVPDDVLASLGTNGGVCR